METPLQKTILLVEDDRLVAMLEKKTLEAAGYTVVTVSTGEDAVARLAQDERIDDERIDLVLMDIDLGPGIDGTEAAERILSQHDLPVVFLSSHTEPEVVEKTEGIGSYGYIVKNSGDTVLLASIRMAFRLHEARVQLNAASEQKDRAVRDLGIVFDSVPAMIWQKDLQGRFLRVNKPWCETVGVSREEILGKTAYDAFPEHLAAASVAEDQEILRSGVPRLGSIKPYPTKDGDPGWIRTDKMVFTDERGEVAGVIGFAVDITEQRQAEEALRESEARNNAIVRAIPDLVFVHERSGKYLDCHAFDEDLLVAERLIGSTVQEALPEETAQKFLEAFERAATTQEVSVIEYSLQVPAGTREFEARIAPMDDGLLLSIVRDVTERKRAEKEIRELVVEKENLLREVHHRVKNTMNTMVGVLNLEADRLEGHPEAAAAMQDAGNRFQSMELLYDQLYRADTHITGSAQDYITQLVNKVVALFPSAETVETVISVEEFVMDAKRLSKLGLIVNELVTNAMKYAFRGRTDGRLTVAVDRGADETVTVVVADDGPGLPDSLNIDTASSFGLTMVEALTEGLGGTIRFERNAGTRCVLEFPVAPSP